MPRRWLDPPITRAWFGDKRSIEGRGEGGHLPEDWLGEELGEITDNSQLERSYAEGCVKLSDTPPISYGDNSQNQATPSSRRHVGYEVVQ